MEYGCLDYKCYIFSRVFNHVSDCDRVSVRIRILAQAFRVRWYTIYRHLNRDLGHLASCRRELLLVGGQVRAHGGVCTYISREEDKAYMPDRQCANWLQRLRA
jgi:hypothetical protein